MLRVGRPNLLSAAGRVDSSRTCRRPSGSSASVSRRPPGTARQWPSFQAVGEALFAEGWAGVLYPAAARPSSLALCLFRTSDPFSGVRPLPPPVRRDTPATRHEDSAPDQVDSKLVVRFSLVAGR